MTPQKPAPPKPQTTQAQLAKTAKALRALLPPNNHCPQLTSLLEPTTVKHHNTYTLPSWFLWLLSGPDTPLDYWRRHHLALKTTALLRHWIEYEDIHPHLWLKPSHNVQQAIHKFSSIPFTRLHPLARAELHFISVLRSILLYTGATVALTSTNRLWSASWLAYGEDQQIHTDHRHSAGAQAATNTVLAVFSLHHAAPDQLRLAYRAATLMATRLIALSHGASLMDQHEGPESRSPADQPKLPD